MRRLAKLVMPVVALIGAAPLFWLSWCERHEEGRLRHEAILSKALERRNAAVLERCDMKLTISIRLLSGELTLFEAAAWFRHLNATPPGYEAHPWPNSDERYPEEMVCRQVIQWASSRAEAMSPPWGEQVRSQLEA